MSNVNKILQTKGDDAFTVTSGTIVYDAIELMYNKKVSSALVVEDEKLIGIFTEKDYVPKLILKGKALKETMIGEVMTEDLITVSPDASIQQCMQIMTTHFIRHLPVMEKEKLVGIVSIGDVVKYLIEEQEFVIENLEHYITGS